MKSSIGIFLHTFTGFSVVQRVPACLAVVKSGCVHLCKCVACEPSLAGLPFFGENISNI